MNVDRLLGRLEKESPLALHLAEVVSLAVLVDPPLLRRARRELVPDADSGIEADLWTSSLVQTRSPDGLVFHSEVAQALRERLATDPDRLDRAWTLTRHVHGHFTPALQLEEEIAWLSVSDSPDAAARIEQLLRQAMAAVFAGERRGLAHWAARALPRLPSRVRVLETARILEAGARLRLDGDARLLENESGDLGWIVPADLPRVPVRVRLLDGAVELDAGATGGTMLQLPQTDPLLVTVSWEEGGKEIAGQATFRPGGKTTIPVPVETVRLRTIRDEVYDLRVSGQPGGRMRSWIIDFTEERERHRPFFGREVEQKKILRLIDETGQEGRLILVQGYLGEGKTALLAHIIDRLAEEGQEPPHHFFLRGTHSERLEVAERSLRAQLVRRSPELESAARYLRLPELMGRWSNMQERVDKPLILVMDAIDEAMCENPGAALLELLPEQLPAGVAVLVSVSTTSALLDLRGVVAPIQLGDPTNALQQFWYQTYNIGQSRQRRLLASPEELVRGSEGSFGTAQVLRRWINGGWWQGAKRKQRPINLEILWKETIERLGREATYTWLGPLAAARGSLPSSLFVELIGRVLFNKTRNSPFEPLLVTTGEPVHRLSEEVLRDSIANRIDLKPYHRRIAEIATAALEKGSGASEQLRSYAVRHAVQHWIAAGDLEGASRLAVSAGHLIPKCHESGIEAVQQELRDCIEAFRSAEPVGNEKVDPTTILESTLDILARGPLPPALDSSLFLSYLFTGLLEQNWEPEIARAILQITPAELVLRPKDLVDRPLRRPGDRRHRGAVVGCRSLERHETVPAILSWSTDGTLKLWEPDSGELIHTFIGHTAEVTGAVQLGWEWLLTSSRDGSLRLWDLRGNRLLRTLDGHEGEVVGVEGLGLSNHRAVSWSTDRTIRVWGVEEGREELILRGHEDAVTACAVTRDGWYLLSGSADATVRQWQLSNGELASTWRGHTGAVTSVIAAEGLIISTALDRTVRAWPYWASTSFEPMTLTAHSLGVLGCTVLGSLVASWSFDQTIVVRRLDLGFYSGERSAAGPVILRGHTAAVLSCTFFPDGDRLVSASADGTLRIWDVETGETLHVLEGHAGPVRAVALDTEDISGLRSSIAEQIVSASDDRTLRVWNAETGEEAAALDGDNETLHCIALQDRRRIVTWSRMGDLKIHHVDSNEPPSWLGLPGMAVGGALVTSDDRRLILWSRGLIGGRARIAVWDLERGQEIGAIGGPESPIVACTSTQDGSQLVIGSMNGLLSVWDIATSWPIAAPPPRRSKEGGPPRRDPGGPRALGQRSTAMSPAHSGPVVEIQVFLKGEWALSVSWDGILRALDLREISPPRVVGRHKDRILACAIDRDGRLAVTASADRTLRIWDIEEGGGPLLSGHDDQVTGCAFTWEGARVVSCSLDGTLGIWDVHTGALLHRLRGHQDWVNAFVIDDERGVVYSCSEDRTVRAWDLASGEQRGVAYGVSPFRSLALTYDGIAAGDEAGNFWALEYVGSGQSPLERIPSGRFVRVDFILEEDVQVARLRDEWLARETEMYLCIQSDLPDGEVLGRIETAKIGTSSDLPLLKQRRLFGLDIALLKRTPGGLPVREDYHYFTITKEGPYWDAVARSREIVISGGDPRFRFCLYIVLKPKRDGASGRR